jgi:hypothetical protein
MAESGELLGIYLHLARASEARNRPLVRDKLLVLAGAIAAESGLAPIASVCRSRILASNPGHLVGHYPTIADALNDERFQNYRVRLQSHYSRERAEHMLQSLGIELARERAAYYDDGEYAATLLSASPEELESASGPPALPALDSTPPANPYAPPHSPLPIKRRPLILGDRWLALTAILALLILPLAMALLIALAKWLGRT